MERLETIEAVQRMQDFIKAHLAEPITLKELAAAAGYSQWHCQRLFKELTGKTPFDYIRALRLSKAALTLRDGQPRVIDVAFDFVFDSHEGFTKAFTKQFGLPPARYAKEAPPIRLFIPYSIRDYYRKLHKGVSIMEKEKNANTIFVQVVERPKRKLMLKRGTRAEDYWAYCEEVGCDIWGVLVSVKEALYEPIGMWLPKSLMKEGSSKYAQGVELPLDFEKPLPDGFEIIELPPCKMMVFQGAPYKDENFEEAITDLWEVMKGYDPTLYGFEWADGEAPRFQMEPQGYRGYIEARPVREIGRK